MDQEAVPATMNKSGLQIEAEKFSQDMQTPSTVLVWIFGSRTAISTRILGRAAVSVSEAARYVKDMTKQVIPVTDEVPDATDSLNYEFDRVKLTQEAAIARYEGRLAKEAEGRELPERPFVAGTDDAQVCEGEPERSWHKGS